MGFFSGFSSGARKRHHHGNGSSHYQQGGFGNIGGMFGGFMGSSISSSKRRHMGGYGAPIPHPGGHVPTAAPQQAAPRPQAPVAGGATCPSCGASVPAGSKFCLECGTKLGGSGFCGQCGATLPPTGKFCPECGAPRG